MQSNSHIILASGLQLPAAGAAASARPSQHQLAPAQAQSISDLSLPEDLGAKGSGGSLETEESPLIMF